MLVSVITVVVLLVIIYLLARPVIRGAIFFPATGHNVDIMMNMAKLHSGDRVVDLGSGDGRIVIACAREGIRAEGYEINPILVLLSRRRIRQAGLKGLAKVYWKSFWRVDLSPFDTVFVYGIPYIMHGLQGKLLRELRPGAKVISNIFLFPGWAPLAKQEKVFLYQIEEGPAAKNML
jgi:precorrin-6B methylase 2